MKFASLITGQARCRGIVLPELLVILAAVVILGAGAAVGGNTILQNGRYNTARTDLAHIEMAISQYHFETGAYPATLAELTKTYGQYGPWIDSDSLLDPWGNAYQYTVSSEVSVWSTGPTGTGKIVADPSA